MFAYIAIKILIFISLFFNLSRIFPCRISNKCVAAVFESPINCVSNCLNSEIFAKCANVSIKNYIPPKDYYKTMNKTIKYY